MKKLFVVLLFQLFTLGVIAQKPALLSLSECYRLAEQNYPLSKQRDLLTKAAAYTIENIQKGYLPQFNLNGLASYQSEVTQLPIQLPGMVVPAMSKDQYKLYGEINQLIYDGGVLKQQKELQQANTLIEQRKLETTLYQLRERINQLFFGALLIGEQLKQNELMAGDIQLGLRRVQAAIDNGTALKSNADVLKADLLKNKQRRAELLAIQKSYHTMLGLFIGKAMAPEINLLKPAPIITSVWPQIKRPELLVYESQNKNLDVQNNLLTTKARPKFSFFLQGGYGRPALNFLNNNFETYYLSGFRLSWSPTVFYTLKKDRQLLNLNRNTIEVQKETFLFNTNLTLRQQRAEIDKYLELLSTDEEIIALRSKIKATAMVQLENGVINGNDYLREVNAENEARQNKILHETQLLLAQYNEQTTSGN
ncbi:MAG: TolC family protein [Bacteroidota bacterium]